VEALHNVVLSHVLRVLSFHVLQSFHDHRLMIAHDRAVMTASYSERAAIAQIAGQRWEVATMGPQDDATLHSITWDR
jgi:hypothetical protein